MNDRKQTDPGLKRDWPGEPAWDAAAPKQRRMSSAALKWIAALTMLADHVGAALLESHIVGGSGWFMGDINRLYSVDMILRTIGRMAFPLYIFLMVEGFFFTRSRVRYAGRLMLLAAASEIPFDLAFKLQPLEIAAGKIVETSYQNVFFELVLGILAMMVLEFLRTGSVERDGEAWEELLRIPLPVRLALGALIVAGLCLFGEWLGVDYGWSGIAAMALAYCVKVFSFPGGWDGTREVRLGSAGARTVEFAAIMVPLVLNSSMEVAAIGMLPAVRYYDGSRGRTINKWFFYWYYPVHLLILGLIRFGLGLPAPF